MSTSEEIHIDKLYFTDKLKKDLSSILDKPITIIEAPMGYGKTVAVREFLKNQQTDVLWVPLSSCPKGGYWELFCRILEEQYPQEARTAAQLRTLGFPEEDEGIYQVLDILKRHEFDKPMVIVLDDYQLVNHCRMSRLVEAMVQSTCGNLHGLLITRNTYCGNSEILSLKGYLKVINRDSFIFCEEDIRTYYRECGVILSDEETERLYKVTEGWICALYLYLLRYEKEGIIAFPTNIYELIDKELFSQYTDEMKELLFALTPFGDFNYNQAEFVWGKDNLHDLLTRFRFKNAFILYGDRTRRFYIHSIFLRFLEQNMERLPLERRSQYYTRCGDWFGREGDYYTAITYYYKAGNFKNILCALENEYCDGIPYNKWFEYAKMLRECPIEALGRNIRCVFLMSIAALLVNDMESYIWLKTFLEGSQNCCGTDCTTQKGALEFLYALEHYNDIEVMGNYYKKSGELLRESAGFYMSEVPNWTLGSPSILFMFHRSSGSAAREIALMKEKIPAYAALDKGHGMGSAQMMEAEWFLNQGEFEQAEVAAFAAETIAKQYNQESIIFCSCFILLRCALFKGDRETFGKMTEYMESNAMTDKSSSHFLNKQLELSRGFIFAITGQERQIPLWIRREDNYRQNIYRFSYPIYQVIFGRYLLSLKAYSRVIGLFGILIEDPIYLHHALFLIYGYLYIAAAQHGLGWQAKALHTLKKVFELAAPDEIYLPLAENYDGLSPLFQLLYNEGFMEKEIQKIKHLAAMLESGKEKVFGNRQGAGLLSIREKELARLACSAKTYGEIAEELFLARSTVKRSMVIIFKKLGIHSRDELPEHMEEFQE